MAKILYFSGTTEVFGITSMDNRAYRAAFSDVKGCRCDSFSMWVGFTANTDSRDRMRCVGALPVTRVITRKANPSNHKCDARCRYAKGGNCECSCGGQFHGAAN